MKKTIEVNEEWLRDLLELAQKAKQYSEREDTFSAEPAYSQLIGYATSARHMLEPTP